jgi:peptidoglycan hydrolase-like protein with peptidoglycan-binding domain
MKALVVILVAALSLAVAADGHTRTRHYRGHHPVAAATHAAAHKIHTIKHRARRRARTTAPRASSSDEIVLSPALMRQLHRNLVDGGYYTGAVDGRLTPRTRHALADFQREYHLRMTGHLDRPTAEALLGRDAVASAFLPARM